MLVLCMSANAFGSDWAALESGTFRFRDPLNRERRFIPLRLDAAPIKGSLAQFLYINWLPEEREPEYGRLLEACQPPAKPPMATTLVYMDDPRLVRRPINLGFDGAIENGYPHGWFDSLLYVSGVSTDYKVQVIKRDEGRSGRCLMLRKTVAIPEEFASVMQRFPANHLAGRVVRLEGEIRTQDVQGWAGLWLRADGDQQSNLFFDNMSRHNITGTTNWACHAVEGQLPVQTTWLNIGVVFSGSGVVGTDRITLRVWTTEGKWEDV